MQVLKLFYRLILSRKNTILILIGIFLLMIIPANYVNRQLFDVTFNPEMNQIITGIVNLDKGDPISENLIEYLGQTTKIVEVENDEERLVDMLYNQQISDAVIIPDGYGRTLIEATLDKDRESPSIERKRGLFPEKSIYIDSLLSMYVSNFYVNALSVDNIDEPGRLDEMLHAQTVSLSDDIKIKQSEREADIDVLLYGLTFSLFASYIYYMLFISSFGTPALAMREKTVRIREKMTAISDSSRNIQFFLGCTSFSLIVWLLSTLAAYIFYGSGIFTEDMGRFLVLSSFFSTFGLSGLAFFLATVSPNSYFLTFCEVGLGLFITFASGIFTGTDMGGIISKIASFATPIWQVRANLVIVSSISLTQAQISEISNYFLIMLALGLAYYAVSFVIMRYRRLSH
ncbi:MAG: ABC transporter permease [Candidatus Scatomorpha sp.]|jgi:hypothetical protein